MARRSSHPGPKREIPSQKQKVLAEGTLEVVGDDEESVTLGWVGPGVFYARFLGTLSADGGREHAVRLQQALDQVASLHYFGDASGLKSYDLLARSTFTRLVLTNRRKFSSLVILTWAEGVSAATRGFARAIGEPVDVLTDADEFEARMLQAAPFAKRKLDPRTWVRVPGVSRSLR